MKCSKFLSIFHSDIKIKLFVSFLLSFLFVTGYSLNQGDGKAFLFILFLYLIDFLLCYLFLSIIYFCFDKANINISKKNIRYIYFISFLVLVFFYFIEFSALYPGMFNYDGPAQLDAYLNDQISEWHPVLHTVIIGKIITFVYSLGFEVIQGIACYTIIQFIFIALCFSYLLKYLYSKTNFVIWLISALYLSAFPTITLQVFSSTKDSFFMGLFSLCMTLSLEFMTDTDDFIKNKFKQFFLIVSIVGILIFRHNCVYAIPVYALMILLFCKTKKNVLIILAVSFIVFILYKVLFVPYYVTVQMDGREKLSVPAQQISMIYIDEDSVVSDDDKNMIESLMYPLFLYSIPSSADIAKASINYQYYEDNKTEVHKMWLRLVCDNPVKAIRTFEDLNCGFWYPIYDLTWIYDGRKGYWEVWGDEPFFISSKNPALLQFYLFFTTTDFSNIKMIPIYLLFAPATFFYLFILMFGYAYKIKNRPFVSFLTFALAYWCTFLLGPVALVRYVTFLYSIVPLYFLLILKKGEKSEKSE